VPLTHSVEGASATGTEGRDALSLILGIGCSKAVAFGSLGKFRIRVCGLEWFPKDVVVPSPISVYCTGAPIYSSKPSSGSSSVGSKNEVMLRPRHVVREDRADLTSNNKTTDRRLRL